MAYTNTFNPIPNAIVILSVFVILVASLFFVLMSYPGSHYILPSIKAGLESLFLYPVVRYGEDCYPYLQRNKGYAEKGR